MAADDETRNGWRKGQACARCRRIKVKCYFAEKTDEKCVRCTKAQVECHMEPVQHEHDNEPEKRSRAKRTRLAIVPRSESDKSHDEVILERLEALAREPCNSRIDRLKRVQTLEGIVARASRTLERLTQQAAGDAAYTDSMPSFVDEPHAAAYNRSDQWKPRDLRRIDVVQTAIEFGLITLEEARLHYDHFRKHLLRFFLIFLVGEHEFDEMRVVAPVMTMAMIVSDLTTQSTDIGRALELNRFMQRVLLEWTFIEARLSTEIVRSMLLMVVYFRVGSDLNRSFVLMTTHAISTVLNLGSREDAALIADETADKAERDAAIDRVRCFLELYAAFSSMTVSTGRTQFMRMLPSCSFAIDMMLAHGTPEDRMLGLMVRMMMTGIEGIEDIKRHSSHPFAVVRHKLDLYLRRVEDTVASLQLIMKQVKTIDDNATMFKTAGFHKIALSLNEEALNALLGTYRGEEDSKLLVSLGYDISKSCYTVIDAFDYALGTFNMPMPQVLFYRVLQILGCLIRLRLVMLSKGITTLVVDIDEPFAKVKARWEAARNKSLVAAQLYTNLLRLEKWINLKTKDGTRAIDYAQSAATLLKDMLSCPGQRRGARQYGFTCFPEDCSRTPKPPSSGNVPDTWKRDDNTPPHTFDVTRGLLHNPPTSDSLSASSYESPPVTLQSYLSVDSRQSDASNEVEGLALLRTALDDASALTQEAPQQYFDSNNTVAFAHTSPTADQIESMVQELFYDINKFSAGYDFPQF
ncbi:hypothetical protein TRVA0_007S03972 [Trichomonascus vanleenenianus]|uniref:Zn(II)2Cys6 transcription factor domain-containing protein n=1 Tax=Trichomonascus vanleenenianus TaxID=2268995 RepID=UPI003ECA4A0B